MGTIRAILGPYWGYIGVIGIVEKEMETTRC